MKSIFVVPLMLGTLLSLSTPLLAAEKIVPLSSVPQPAIDAAKAALGADPSLAKIVIGTKPREYELQAKNASDQRMSALVRESGTVVMIDKKL